MAEHFDVAIVGGAVMGSAVAYFLAADPDFHGSVAVIERDPGYANCTTARSWGGVRQQFSTAENIEMSLFAADFFRRAGELLDVGGEAPVLDFREDGYLLLASPAGLPMLQANVTLQRELGAQTELLLPAALGSRFPWLSGEGIAAGAFGPANEGWLDPNALLHGFRRKARALGVSYLEDEAVGIETAKGRVEAIELRGGGRLACGTLVNAAGPRAGALAALAGVDLPVRPRKRTTFVFDCRERLPVMPLIFDVSGIACRPEGAQFLAIVSPPEEQDRDSDGADMEPDYAPFEEVIWPTLAKRIPAFEAIKLTRAWACHYDYNAFDQNAILGPHPEISNLLFCNGFSGHGLQQSPATGRAIAELIVHGEYRSLDLSALSYARIPENRPLKEANVV
ncbi:MAG: FAD-binding oxidoreductase [Kiloniellales bacterium]